MLNIILDVDTGVDDAYALILALCNRRCNVRAVTTCQGNVGVEQVTKNTRRILDLVSEQIPIGVGAAVAIAERPHFCPEIHGVDGLGDLSDKQWSYIESGKKKTSVRTGDVDVGGASHAETSGGVVAGSSPSLKRARLEEREGLEARAYSRTSNNTRDAVELLVECIEHALEHDYLLHLVCLAPLTNVAALVQKHSSLLHRADANVRIVFMGGAANAIGNATAVSEANILCDPEAAALVLGESRLPITMYGLDVYEELMLSSQLVEPGAADQLALVRLARALLERDAAHFRMPAACIGDAGALLLLLVDESSYVCEQRNVRVETRGEFTRGMTVVDRRREVWPPDEAQLPANVSVVVSLNADVFLREFVRSIWGDAYKSMKLFK